VHRQSLRAVQRVAAYALLPDAAGAPYLMRTPTVGSVGHWWSLPGGQVGHGEPPAQTAVRIARSVTGADVEVTGVREVLADVVDLADRGLSVHTVRIVFDARLATAPGHRYGDAVPVPLPELPGLPLSPFAVSALGVAARPLTAPDIVEPLPDNADRLIAATAQLGPDPTPAALPSPVMGAARAPRVQRPGAYALVVETGRVLLSRYVRDGRWSLPGGGIHHGEQPVQALYREVREETGLMLDDPRLVDVDSVHFTGHSPRGQLEDFHAVRIVYTGTVPAGSRPQVLEVDGTADAAAWVPLDTLDRLETTQLVRRVLHRVS
jgi:8-oxo-dGTP diphosphatase